MLTPSGMRLSRGTPIEGMAPMRLMMSENRSSSVIWCSVSRARSSGEAAWPWATPDSAIVSRKASDRRLIACMVCLLSHDRIASHRLAEERRAELGRALVRLEVHAHQPEAMPAEPGVPCEVVHQ